jgi:hypothetical protein
MTEKCGAGYTSAIWGIPRNIVYLCNLPKGHGGYHHGEDEETGTYTNWPDITITTSSAANPGVSDGTR